MHGHATPRRGSLPTIDPCGKAVDQEVCDALPVGYWLVGTPTFRVATSEYGRDYRLGPQLHRGAVSFESGCDAQCRESPATGRAGALAGGRGYLLTKPM